ncbi:P-loop containing nucleoside triphosphate hydrolase protein [Schizophyllum amplum]|uniref:RNA helicase n=1 Tax=Schizophyllum amplum TaxID=97359 RepID=A0A550CHN6_9AGAR|nr:P-loop containing nucleoside triphosphate hydrolase protein [Auriculariopsis ampla]
MSLKTDEEGWVTQTPTEQSELLEPAHDVQVTLADPRADPNSPLYSVKTFQELGLHSQLQEGLVAMGFTRPSKIQEKALPMLLRDPPMNFIGQSQSGTGKTAAFVLTMLSRIDVEKQTTQAICIAPSRELARQIMSVVTAMSKFTKVTTEFAIKDDNGPSASSRINAHLIVGTPGTMAFYLNKRIINKNTIKVFVLDEADTMIATDGLGDHTNRVKTALGPQGDPLEPRYQIILFSATFNDKVRAFADKFAPNANKIELKKEEVSVAGIKQFFLDCESVKDKYDKLVMLYNILTVGQSIIFCQHRHEADTIAQRMIAEGHKVAALHGAKDGPERDRIIDRFREGHEKVLITTNVIARGIDILQVNMVVNYDLPLMSERDKNRFNPNNDKPDLETYIHRIGRTGRFGRRGISINFVHDKKSHDLMEYLSREMGREILPIPTQGKSEEEIEEYVKNLLKKDTTVGEAKQA